MNASALCSNIQQDNMAVKYPIIQGMPVKNLVIFVQGVAGVLLIYFIFVLFADGDRSLLSLPSVFLARWCELGFIVVILSLVSLSVFSLPANRPVSLPKCETTNKRLTGRCLVLCVRPIVLQSSLVRSILTTILNRRTVCVLCAGSGYGGSSCRLLVGAPV